MRFVRGDFGCFCFGWVVDGEIALRGGLVSWFGWGRRERGDGRKEGR